MCGDPTGHPDRGGGDVRRLRAAGLVLAVALGVAAASGTGGCGPGPAVTRRAPPASNEAFRVKSVVRSGVQVVAEGEASVFEGAFVVEALDGSGRVLTHASVQAQAGAPAWAGFTAKLTLPDQTASTARSLRLYEASPKDGSPQHVLYVPIPSTSI